MSGTTGRGLPYPDPTDPLHQGADAIKALAEATGPIVPIYADTGAARRTNLRTVLISGLVVTPNGTGDFTINFSGQLTSILAFALFSQNYPVGVALINSAPAAATFRAQFMNGTPATQFQLWGTVTGASTAAVTDDPVVVLDTPEVEQ